MQRVGPRRGEAKWKMVTEYPLRNGNNGRIVPDAVFLDKLLARGIYEAKYIQDDLEAEISVKLERGYPANNLLFWAPARAVLYQLRPARAGG